MNKSIFLVYILFSLFACGTSEHTSQDKIVDATTPINIPPPTLCSPKRGLALAIYSKQSPPLFEGLGNLDYPITTTSELAQKYFNQGLALAYSFNHAEAARSFIAATRQDSTCAMCHWGLAYVLGPNYNAGMEPEVIAVANEALTKAKAISNITPKEKDLIAALSKRYPSAPVEDRSSYDAAYAKALETLTKKYPDDIEIAGFYAEARMDEHPWDLWQKDGHPQPWTEEILAILQESLAKSPNHAASNHLYIHAVEASLTPELGTLNADRLGNLMPNAGHLVHMPSHIYIRTGEYHKGTLANQQAVTIDSLYVSACHAAGIYPLAYYPHNYHFLTACAALEGNSKVALEAAEKMVGALDLNLLTEPGWGTIQHYYTIPWYIMVKFKMWGKILATEKPADNLKYPSAIWQYAQGMANVGHGNLNQAAAALTLLKELEKDESIKDVTVWDINNCHELVRIAVLVLGGEIAQAKGNYDESISLLSQAIEIEDQLNYNEPPDWFFSVRQHLGPVLLKTEKYAAAETIYRRDLELFPETGFALHGLYQSLTLQGKTTAAAEVKQRFQKAWKWADIML